MNKGATLHRAGCSLCCWYSLDHMSPLLSVVLLLSVHRVQTFLNSEKLLEDMFAPRTTALLTGPQAPCSVTAAQGPHQYCTVPDQDDRWCSLLPSRLSIKWKEHIETVLSLQLIGMRSCVMFGFTVLFCCSYFSSLYSPKMFLCDEESL